MGAYISNLIPGCESLRRPDWRWRHIQASYKDRRMPKTRDEYLYRGYMYYRRFKLSDPEKLVQNIEDYIDIYHAHMFHDGLKDDNSEDTDEQWIRTRYIIEALVLAGESADEIAAWVEGLEPDFVTAYEMLFWDIRRITTKDGKSLHYLKSLTRNTTVFDNEPDYDQYLKHIAVEYGAEGVKFVINPSRMEFDKRIEWLNNDIRVSVLHNAQLAARSTNPGSERNLGLADIWSQMCNRDMAMIRISGDEVDTAQDPLTIALKCSEYFRLDISPSMRKNGDMPAKEPRTLDLFRETIKEVEARVL